MRTTLDFPDPLFRHLKARAALEGRSLRDLVLELLERGLTEQKSSVAVPPEMPDLPIIRLGQPMPPIGGFSNASLASLIDE